MSLQLADLENRVVALERDVAEIRPRLAGQPERGKRWWEMHDPYRDDAEFQHAWDEAVRLGAEWRRSQWDPDDVDYCI